MTLQEMLPQLRGILAEFEPGEAMGDIRRLAAGVLDIAPDRVTLAMQDPLSAEHQATLLAAVRARATRRPVSKIIGRKMFWGRDFLVTDAVLDPRPETECLIETALALGPQGRVLDLGTGSGAIALTLALEWTGTQVVATDLSPEALAVARKNAAALGVTGRVDLVESDWFQRVSGLFDLIVSNPPYVAAEEMVGLSPDVLDHDPRMALTDEADGLQAYRAIAARAGDVLRPGGWLMVEIGPSQGAAVAALFEAGGLQQVAVRPDLDRRDRVVIGTKPL